MSTQVVQKILEKIASGEAKLDVCHMSKYIRNVKNINKKSASPTIVAFGDLLVEALGERGEIGVALKIFLDTSEKPMLGLKYEISVYKYIVDQILSKGYSPNFIPYLGFGRCSYSQIKDLFPDPSEVEYIDKYMNEFLAHPEISVNMLVTGRPTRPVKVVSFADILRSNATDRNMAQIMLQIFYSLYIMGKFRLVHNDLHYRNVLVAVYPKRMKMSFVIGEKSWFVKTRFIPLFFDWDFAYAEPLGDNPKLDSRCKDTNMCNRYGAKFDIYTLLCYTEGSYMPYKFPVFHEFVRNAYHTPSFNLQENEETFTIPKEEAEAVVSQFKPDFSNVYKMSRFQLVTLAPSLDGRLPKKITSIMFSLDKYGDEITVFKGFNCRPTVFDSTIPTPEEVLFRVGDWMETPGAVTNYFRRFETKEVVTGDDVSVYRAPESVGHISSKIYMDPSIRSTREKIQGRPRFPPHRSVSAYVAKSSVARGRELYPVRIALSRPLLSENINIKEKAITMRLAIHELMINLIMNVAKFPLPNRKFLYDIYFNAMAIMDLIMSDMPGIGFLELSKYATIVLLISARIYTDVKQQNLDTAVAIIGVSDKETVKAIKNDIFKRYPEPLYGTIYTYIKHKYRAKGISIKDLILSVWNMSVYKMENADIAAQRYIKDPKSFTNQLTGVAEMQYTNNAKRLEDNFRKWEMFGIASSYT